MHLAQAPWPTHSPRVFFLWLCFALSFTTASSSVLVPLPVWHGGRLGPLVDLYWKLPKGHASTWVGSSLSDIRWTTSCYDRARTVVLDLTQIPHKKSVATTDAIQKGGRQLLIGFGAQVEPFMGITRLHFIASGIIMATLLVHVNFILTSCGGPKLSRSASDVLTGGMSGCLTTTAPPPHTPAAVHEGRGLDVYIKQCLDGECWDCVEQSGVDGAMVARRALIKPWMLIGIEEHREWDISACERLEGIQITYHTHSVDKISLTYEVGSMIGRSGKGGDPPAKERSAWDQRSLKE
ncbi:hypothetical protein C8R43DRAFT_961560 [Mycena crocata]|nr:hypothetical protein C8R43DRAFT_961560 [Mycena crocata]